MGVVDNAFKIATTGFDFKKSIDQHRGAYVRRRGDFLHKLNSTWSADRLATQLKAELTVVQNYIAGKDPLINGTETTSAPHLDLKIGSFLLTNIMVKAREVSETFQSQYFEKALKELRAKRVEAVNQIVWRAVMIHSDVLWKSLGPPPQLQEPALNEILDRRLSTIEQMHITVNSFGHGLGSRTWEVAGPTGPWRDGFRRAFEYPNVRPATNFIPFLSQLGADWQLAGNEVQFNPANQVRVRATPKVKAAWTMSASKKWINFRPMSSMTPAQIVEEMFVLRDDFWNRSWMFCDHVCSLVNIVALGFALFRRTGKPDEFDAVMKKTDYISLGPVVTEDHDFDTLMADDQDQFFENTDVSLDDLQLGDFVRFWNSRLYELLPPYFGDWGSEFSLIME
ncbi:MAG TPA: hypothetical protein VFT02_12320, partial [Pyrinomonadaceae bacterium]|nr:hypothetical protein [Pyrinomonadaceae bacterium]